MCAGKQVLASSSHYWSALVLAQLHSCGLHLEHFLGIPDRKEINIGRADRDKFVCEQASIGIHQQRDGPTRTYARIILAGVAVKSKYVESTDDVPKLKSRQ
jgi:hypothetical protein